MDARLENVDMKQPDGSKIRVIVVDDEEILRMLLCEKIKAMGYECDTASDGMEGIELVRKNNNYDLVLLDVHMPRLNGIDTLKFLKAHDPDISVIMVSASQDLDHVRTALKLGAYDYILKPFEIFDIERAVERAIERARLIRKNRDYQKNLEKKVVEQTQEIVSLYAGTLQAMVTALDLREKETGFHSYRVTEYSMRLGKEMKLPQKELHALAKGALLHDIGKIGVPDSILLKSEKLTDEEWEVIKKHPQLGYDLLKEIQFLDDAADIVFSHHERYDGKGYPLGLSGDDIPIGARIFSVVDTLDAMTSDRVYRKAMSFEEAARVINECSGTQFDPQIVEYFNKIDINDFISIRRKIEKFSSEYLRRLMLEITAK